MDILTIIGVIASIFSAYIAINQARKASDSAKESEKIKGQLIKHREMVELSILDDNIKRLQSRMSKYGPGSTPASLKGYNHETDAKEVQDFLLKLKENREYFGSEDTNEADVLFDRISPLLDKFAIAKDTDLIKDFGKQILLQINNYIPVIKRILNSQKDNALSNAT